MGISEQRIIIRMEVLGAAKAKDMLKGWNKETSIVTKGLLRQTQVTTVNLVKGKKVKELTKETVTGMKRFRMEMLGVMFGGMAMSRMFGSMTQGAIEWLGISDILTTSLNVVALEGLMAVDEKGNSLANTLYDLSSALLDLPDSAKRSLGELMLIGQGSGFVMQTVGQLILMLSSLAQAFGGIAGPAATGIGLLLGKLTGVIDKIPGLEGLSAPLSLIATGITGAGAYKTVTGIFDWIDGDGKGGPGSSSFIIKGVKDSIKTIGPVAIGFSQTVTTGLSALMGSMVGASGITLGALLGGAAAMGTVMIVYSYLYYEQWVKSLEEEKTAMEEQKSLIKSWGLNLTDFTDTTQTGLSSLGDQFTLSFTNAKTAAITAEGSQKWFSNHMNSYINSNIVTVDNLSASILAIPDKTVNIKMNVAGTDINWNEANRFLTNMSVTPLSQMSPGVISLIADLKAKRGYAQGGVVPGRYGEAVPIIAHGGERFEGIGSGTGGGENTVVINQTNYFSGFDKREIENMINSANDKLVTSIKQRSFGG